VNSITTRLAIAPQDEADVRARGWDEVLSADEWPQDTFVAVSRGRVVGVLTLPPGEGRFHCIDCSPPGAISRALSTWSDKLMRLLRMKPQDIEFRVEGSVREGRLYLAPRRGRDDIATNLMLFAMGEHQFEIE
jgi:hypothetical protein